MARYIDADYLDKLITQLIYEGRNITRNEYKMIDNILCEFPTSDVVERKKGKWEDVTIGRWIYAKCSVCGTVHDVQSSFCPNCGAQMEGNLWNSSQ